MAAIAPPISQTKDGTMAPFTDNYNISDRDALRLLGIFTLFGEINDDSIGELSFSMLRQARVLQHQGIVEGEAFTLNISSPGGTLDSLLYMRGVLDTIRRMGIRIVTHVLHEACSGGAGLLQFGDERTIEASGELMIHDVSKFYGKQNNAGMEIAAALHQRHRLQYASLFAQRNTAGHNDPRWWIRKYMGRDDSYFTAAEALELGLVDRILPSPAPSPDGSPLLPLLSPYEPS